MDIFLLSFLAQTVTSDDEFQVIFHYVFNIQSLFIHFI